MHDDYKMQSSNTLDVVDEVRPLTSTSSQVATPEFKKKLICLGFGKLGMKDSKIKSSFMY